MSRQDIIRKTLTLALHRSTSEEEALSAFRAARRLVAADAPRPETLEEAVRLAEDAPSPQAPRPALRIVSCEEVFYDVTSAQARTLRERAAVLGARYGVEIDSTDATDAPCGVGVLRLTARGPVAALALVRYELRAARRFSSSSRQV